MVTKATTWAIMGAAPPFQVDFVVLLGGCMSGDISWTIASNGMIKLPWLVSSLETFSDFNLSIYSQSKKGAVSFRNLAYLCR
jgi:hypothetical protein